MPSCWRSRGSTRFWHGDELLYVGIARIDPATTGNPQAAGVPGRLGTYRRSRLTSDFTVACMLRFVVPALTAPERAALGDGSMSVRDVQALVRDWVHEHVTFSAVVTDPATGVACENAARRTGLPAVGKPSFNPL